MAAPAGTFSARPFQVRFDMTLGKEFVLNERFRLRFNFDAFNVFNHPDFDAPNNDVTFFPNFSGPPSVPAAGQPGDHPAHHRKLAIPAAIDAPAVLSGKCEAAHLFRHPRRQSRARKIDGH